VAYSKSANMFKSKIQFIVSNPQKCPKKRLNGSAGTNKKKISDKVLNMQQCLEWILDTFCKTRNLAREDNFYEVLVMSYFKRINSSEQTFKKKAISL
jgi:hypothetical protein